MKILNVGETIFNRMQDCNPDEDAAMKIFWDENLNGGVALKGGLDHITWQEKQILIVDRGCNGKSLDYTIRI